MRKLHRWLSIIAAAWLLNMAITGVILAWGGIGDSLRERNRAVAPLPQTGLDELLEAAWQTARTAAPDAPIVSLRLGMGNGEPRGVAVIGGEHSGVLFIDPVRRSYIIGQAGAAAPGNAALDTHTFLKRLHRGDIVGHSAGRWLSIVSGLCLLFLAASGVWMYFDMRGKRLRLGRKAWFWS